MPPDAPARGVQPLSRPDGALAGARAPWSVLAPGARSGITIERVRQALTGRAPSATGSRNARGAARPPALAAPALEEPARAAQLVVPAELPAHSRGDARPAAVLCLLFEDGGETHVVLTRRAGHLRSHAGEVCFPGGRLGPGEARLQAALRETDEELGVREGQVEILGELTPLTTRRSLALVYSFVGVFPGPSRAPLRPQVSEVARVFWAPLASLASDEAFHEELWPAVGTPAALSAVPFFEVGAEVVWGATGRMLFELLCLVLLPEGLRRTPEGTLVRS